MTISEEIELLESQIPEARNQATEDGLLLELLHKYTASGCAGPKHYIDRLLQVAEKDASVFNRAWALFFQADANCLGGSYDDAMKLAQQSRALFADLSHQPGLVRALDTLAKIYSVKGNYPEALNNYGQSFKILEEAADKAGMAREILNMGGIYSNKGDYAEAHKHFEEARKIYDESDDKKGIEFLYLKLGQINSGQGNYREAMKNYSLALPLIEQSGNKMATAHAYLVIGEVQHHQGNHTGALGHYLRALKGMEEIGTKHLTGYCYCKMGLIYQEQGNEPEALKNYNRALKGMEEIGDKRGMTHALIHIGEVLRFRGDFDEALEKYLVVLKIQQEIGDNQSIAFSYSNIGFIQERQGNHAEAFKNLLRSLRLLQQKGDRSAIAALYGNIGSLFERQAAETASPLARERAYKRALSSNLRAMQLAEELGNKITAKVAATSLCKTYKAKGDFENALKYHEKFYLLQNDILGEQAQNQMNNLSFQHNLEQKEKQLEIEQLRNVDLKKERDKSEALLLNILPAEVAAELKARGKPEAKLYDDVTVLYTDFVDFTRFADMVNPQALITELDVCFNAFDEITSKYNIEKIKTVGDAYLAVSGLPLANANHAQDVVKASIEIREFMLNRKRETLIPMAIGTKLETFEIRIGIHSGSVVAGIVGVKKFAYDIWGDAVNTAARMEQNSEGGKINISQATFELVKDEFCCSYRGEIEAKNKGKLKMYYVEHANTV